MAVAKARGFEGAISVNFLAKLMLAELYLPASVFEHLATSVAASPDGICKELKAIEDRSSSSSQVSVVQTNSDYANGFIVKPISLDDYDNLVQVIEDYWFGLMQTLPNDNSAVGAVETVTPCRKAV
jgi:hypothetical protein